MIKTLEEGVSKLRRKLDDGTITPGEQARLFSFVTELKRLKRIHRAEHDLLYFAWEYFSPVRNPDNSGNWEGFELQSVDEAPEFHRELCAMMDEVSTVKRNAKICAAAPRGHGKSSYLSKAFPLREIVYRKRKYIIIISQTPNVAVANMEWLSLQLKHNKKLREDFGPLLSPKQQENPKDNSVEFIAWEPHGEEKRLLSKVEAASTGQALRGRNWNGTRPDLVILDDIEDEKNTNTEQLRKELREWFQKVVIPLGDPQGKRTAYVYMGTMVHYDCVLRHVIEDRSDFESKVYRAIISPPERGDLWEQCRLIYTDRENPNRKEDARRFYEQHKDEMDKGVKVLWPEVQPIYKLMTWKWDNGSKAFNTEYMNNPINEEDQIFNPEKFTYWDDKDPGREFKHKDYEIYMGIDFALGKERGDYSAITTIAKSKDTGTVYVIDSYCDRVHPDVFMKVIVDKVLKFQPDGIAAEAQAAQEFFVHKLKEALRGSGYPAHTRVREVKHRQRKELRIEAMLPDIENGTIQFSRKHAMLLEQFERYPDDHDDAIDSLEMAYSISKNGKKKVIAKPAWL